MSETGMIERVLESYQAVYPDERESLEPLSKQLADGDDLQNRETLPGHITAGAIILSPELTRVLLIHHNSLGKWLQPGGHWDPGEASPLEAARREAYEETGVNILRGIHLAIQDPAVPFDIGVHPVPANLKRHEPEHWHYDWRYVFVATLGPLRLEKGKIGAAEWVGFDDKRVDESIPRAMEKLRRLKIVHPSEWFAA